MQQIDSMEALYAAGIAELKSAEQQGLQAYDSVMMPAVKSPELKQALQKHRAETEQQIQRLEQIQGRLGGQQADVQNEIVMTILKTGKDLQSRITDEKLAEASMVTGAQIIEHYEIAAYGTAATHAKQLGKQEDLQLLLQSLEEEKRTDELLTEIAKGSVNQKAAE
jgi:ferritin-like metal-binding protein YciE